MFAVKINDETIMEAKDVNWKDVPNGVEGVHLVHPVLNISVAAHGYDKYAFLREGVACLQQRIDAPLIGEHIYAVKGDVSIHLRLHKSGKITSEIVDELPELADHVWRYKEVK